MESKKGEHKLVNSRTIAYSIVLILLVAVEAFLISLRSDLDVLFLRTPGMLFQEQPDGSISNLYNYQLLNNTTEEYTIEFKLIGRKGGLQLIGEKIPTVAGNDKAEGALFINIPGNSLESGKNNIIIGVYSKNKLINKVKTTFFGPIK